MYTNANIVSQYAYPVVEVKEPLWKQLPRVPPSAGRDTTFEDFQRGAAENTMRQKRFIPVSHFTEYPYLDILTSQAHQHNFGSLIMIPMWGWLMLAHCVGTTELSALHGSVYKAKTHKAATWGWIIAFLIRPCAPLKGIQLTALDSVVGGNHTSWNL